VILTSDGQVLTNAHVVSGATSVRVTLDGETRGRAATVIGTDPAKDLALLQISGASGLTPAPLGSSSAARVGDDVVAIGNALALEGGPTVTKGIISALDRNLDESAGTMSGLLQTDASISSGNSGGPLIDASGSVIGINTAVATSSRSSSAENIGFAIAIDTARPVIEQLRQQAPAASAALLGSGR
jgi:putative serine protease PepD